MSECDGIEWKKSFVWSSKRMHEPTIYTGHSILGLVWYVVPIDNRARTILQF